MDKYKYYFFEGMLYRKAGDAVEGLIEGKGWMPGWRPSEGAIDDKNIISETEAKKIGESWGEPF